MDASGSRSSHWPEAMEMSFKMIKARIAEDHSDRRRAARVPVEVEATMRELGANGVEATVLNISETGFMARSDIPFEVGTRVWLLLPGRERASAIVKWTAGDKIGAEFAEPISLADLKP
jgi:PilZ domain-containing protein